MVIGLASPLSITSRDSISVAAPVAASILVALLPKRKAREALGLLLQH